MFLFGWRRRKWLCSMIVAEPATSVWSTHRTIIRDVCNVVVFGQAVFGREPLTTVAAENCLDCPLSMNSVQRQPFRIVPTSGHCAGSSDGEFLFLHRAAIILCDPDAGRPTCSSCCDSAWSFQAFCQTNPSPRYEGLRPHHGYHPAGVVSSSAMVSIWWLQASRWIQCSGMPSLP